MGSSICGGSAIAATAPVIHADDEEVAQAISVIFFFQRAGSADLPFGWARQSALTPRRARPSASFAGTAVNDTASVTAAASTWDSMWNLGSQTLDKAVTVKLTRTLAIIPITLVLSLIQSKQNAQARGSFQFKKAFPMFLLWFLC